MAGGYLPYGLAPSGELTAYTPTLRERASDWLRQKLFTDDRAGQDKANRLMDVASVTPFGFAMDAYDAGRAGGRGDYLTAGTIAAMSALPGPAPERRGIRAFHGSPHSFDRFDMSKIGTGEGAQAYGHGLYFAENEDIARGYRSRLSNNVAMEKNGEPTPWGNYVTEIVGAAQATGIHPDQAGQIAKNITDLMDAGKSVKWIKSNYSAPAGFEAAWNAALDAATPYKKNKTPGKMYEVNINADPNTFLDWDKPLSEQPQNVRDALADVPLGRSDYGSYLWQGVVNKKNAEGAIGEHMADPMPAIKTGPKAAMEHLRQAGIPGIKYLDAGSRGAGDGTRNYVVFDDRLVSIVRKYGIAGASAMLGYNILNGMDDAQAAELKRIENSK